MNRESAAPTRQLGFWMTSALVVGTMIGSGIFMLPVSLAPYGPNAVVGWIVSGVGAVSLAFAMGFLARDGGHGIQAYIERAFGPFVAFLATFAFWVSSWAAIAAVAIVGASVAARLIPALAGDTSIAVTAVGLIVLMQVTNALGARSTGRLAVLTTAIKILPLLGVLVVLAQAKMAGEPLSPLAPMPVTFDNIAAASAITLFALLGFETAVAPVDKIRDPERTIPRAIVGGTAFVAILYLVSSTAILLLLSVQGAAASNSPFADAIGRGWGEAGAMFVAVGIAISTVGYVNANVLVIGELGYSMALRRELPGIFARTRGANTPLNAQLLGSALSVALIVANMSKGTGDLFTFMALLTTSATLWLYLVASLAALKRRPGKLALVVILIGFVFVLYAFYGSGLEANLWSLALLAAGAALYWLMHRLNWRAATPQPVPAPAALPE
jgi:APA family basic amino acid/polyamine antiporter